MKELPLQRDQWVESCSWGVNSLELTAYLVPGCTALLRVEERVFSPRAAQTGSWKQMERLSVYGWYSKTSHCRRDIYIFFLLHILPRFSLWGSFNHTTPTGYYRMTLLPVVDHFPSTHKLFVLPTHVLFFIEFYSDTSNFIKSF